MDKQPSTRRWCGCGASRCRRWSAARAPCLPPPALARGAVAAPRPAPGRVALAKLAMWTELSRGGGLLLSLSFSAAIRSFLSACLDPGSFLLLSKGSLPVLYLVVVAISARGT